LNSEDKFAQQFMRLQNGLATSMGSLLFISIKYPKLNHPEVNTPKLCCTDIIKHAKWHIQK